MKNHIFIGGILTTILVYFNWDCFSDNESSKKYIEVVSENKNIEKKHKFKEMHIENKQLDVTKEKAVTDIELTIDNNISTNSYLDTKPSINILFSYASNTGISENPLIDKDIQRLGNSISGDLEKIISLNKGEDVEFDFLDSKIIGKVRSSKNTEIGSKYIRVDFLKNQEGYYMSFHSHESFLKGKIYTKDGSYIYEGDAHNGYIMTIEDYKKSKDALHYD